MAKSHYEVLSVSKNASQKEIKEAYKRLALRYHPDRNHGDKASEEKFKEATEAFEVLNSVEERRKYDNANKPVTSTPFSSTIFNENGFFGSTGSGKKRTPERDIFRNFKNPIYEDIDDDPRERNIYGQPFAQKEQGVSLRVPIPLTLDEIVNGVKKTLEVGKAIQCKRCSGNGKVSLHGKKCHDCNGSGTKMRDSYIAYGNIQIPEKCTACNGTGWAEDCPDCRGKGIVQGVELVHIKIAAGWEDGSQVLYKGMGNAGENGAENGDLIVVIKIDNKYPFKIEGRDLLYKLNLSVIDAMLGAKVEIPSIEGKVKIDIPAGCKTGQMFRIANKGLPYKNLQRGDIKVEVIVFIPDKLTDREKKIIEELRGSGSFRPKG